MTQKQKRQYEFIARALDHVCQEMFDGYALVGYVAGSKGAPVQIVHADSHEMAHALNHLLLTADVPCPKEE